MAVDEQRVRQLRGVFADDRGRITAPTIERRDGRVFTIPMPSNREILRLSNAEMVNILQRFGVSPDWNGYFTTSAAYTSRLSSTLSSLSTDTAAFASELERQAFAESRKHLIGSVRRAQENYTTNRVLEGLGPNQEFIRILDSHDNQCEPCIARAGIIGTIEEQAAVGLPGTASCDGGDYCRCQLMPID